MRAMVQHFRKKIRKALQDPFWRNVGSLFSGTAIGQALPIIIFPLLTRIYPKIIFDVYFIYSSIILLTKIISNLQYHYALLLPKKESDARALLAFNTFISLGVSVLLFLIILAIHPAVSKLIENPNLADWLYFVPISTFLLGLFETFMFYLNRLKKYRQITYGRISKGVVLVVTQSLFGFIGFTADGLLYGLIIAQVISAALLIFYTMKNDPACFVYARGDIGRLARRYKDMPLYDTLISFLNNLSSQLPVFMLTRFFGAGASGDFGMSNKIVNTPMGMVANSVGQVFYRETSDIMHGGRDLKAFVKKMYRNMFRIGLIPFAFLLFTAPWLFDLVLSDDYMSTGFMTQVLVPFYFISFINNPATSLLTMLNKQKAGTLYQLALLIGRMLALGAGILWFDHVLVTVGLFSLVSIGFNVFLYFYLLRIATNPNTNYHI